MDTLLRNLVAAIDASNPEDYQGGLDCGLVTLDLRGLLQAIRIAEEADRQIALAQRQARPSLDSLDSLAKNLLHLYWGRPGDTFLVGGQTVSLRELADSLSEFVKQRSPPRMSVPSLHFEIPIILK